MREQFVYWYPVDFRNSAKELIPNHLTFYIFHHVALFNPNLWPRAIGTNGMITIEGQKMSKSKGVFITLKNAIDSFGADTTRFVLMNSMEGLQDADFRNKDAESVLMTLKNFYLNFNNLLTAKTSSNFGNEEKWLLSKLQTNIKNATDSYEQSRMKSAIQYSFYEMNNDLKWYLRRVEVPNKKALVEFLANWLKMVSTIIPVSSEDLWEKMGNKEFISLAEWPSFDKSLVNEESEQLEKIMENTLRDVRQIQKIMKKQSKQVFIIIAKDEKFAKSKIKKSNALKFFKDAQNFLERELKCKVTVEDGDKSRLEKAQKAMPEKPAIYIEE